MFNISSATMDSTAYQNETNQIKIISNLQLMYVFKYCNPSAQSFASLLFFMVKTNRTLTLSSPFPPSSSRAYSTNSWRKRGELDRRSFVVKLAPYVISVIELIGTKKRDNCLC